MMEMLEDKGGLAASNGAGGNGVPGIIIAGGWRPSDPPGEEVPRITAFIWGGKVRPAPTLPYGRWKGAA